MKSTQEALRQEGENMMGKKVRFIPAFVPRECPANAKTQKPDSVTGRVVHVNQEHGHFTAEYGWEGSKQKESFKFSQIGKDVTVCG